MFPLLIVAMQADLGTARREYISTVDAASKYRKITLDQVEAAREANKKGSNVHRIAEANKSQLSAWNSELLIIPILRNQQEIKVFG